MQTVAQSFANPVAMQAFQAFAAPRANITDTEGQRIRLTAANLFRQGRLTEADLLTHAALQHYPNSEDVLVIRALLCEVQKNWHEAAALLERLVNLQAEEAPVSSWCHWVRVQRCKGDLRKARKTVLHALQLHPAHPLLASELAQIEVLSSSDTPQSA